MILPDHEIAKAIENDTIYLSPYNPDAIQPASYDVSVGGIFKQLAPERKEIRGNFTLKPGMFVLGTTIEHLNLPWSLVARLEGKSTLGRKGLIVHATAGYIDPGFDGQITLELSCFMPVEIKAGMPIAQLSFHKLTSNCKYPYSGKYQNQVGPTEAR